MNIALPFNKEQFLDSMMLYHQETWPAVWIITVIAIFVAFMLILKPNPKVQKYALLFLGLLWAWMGAVYHLTFFIKINPAAKIFGAFFLLQAGLLIFSGFRSSGKPRKNNLTNATHYFSYFFIAYSLVIYPLIGLLTGHGYPRGPIFGLPCPVTIYTFAILLLLGLEVRTMFVLMIIPVIWSVIGTFAAIRIEIFADWMLAISAIVTLFLTVERVRVRYPLETTFK